MPLTYPMEPPRIPARAKSFSCPHPIGQAALTLGGRPVSFWASSPVDEVPLLLTAMAIGTADVFFFYAIFALRVRRNDRFKSITSVFYFCFILQVRCSIRSSPPRWFSTAALLNPLPGRSSGCDNSPKFGIGNFHSILLEGTAISGFLAGGLAYARACLPATGVVIQLASCRRDLPCFGSSSGSLGHFPPP